MRRDDVKDAGARGRLAAQTHDAVRQPIDPDVAQHVLLRVLERLKREVRRLFPLDHLVAGKDDRVGSNPHVNRSDRLRRGGAARLTLTTRRGRRHVEVDTRGARSGLRNERKRVVGREAAVRDFRRVRLVAIVESHA